MSQPWPSHSMNTPPARSSSSSVERAPQRAGEAVDPGNDDAAGGTVADPCESPVQAGTVHRAAADIYVADHLAHVEAAGCDHRPAPLLLQSRRDERLAVSSADTAHTDVDVEGLCRMFCDVCH